MLCPLGNPVFLFIITDRLKMGSLVKKSPENLHAILPQMLCLFENELRIIIQKLECGGESFCCLGS
jgi:hypothetical protein